jgi:hypothetical protein
MNQELWLYSDPNPLNFKKRNENLSTILEW